MEILNVSVDRLTFVGGISDRRLLDQLQVNPFVKGQGRAKFPYDYTWYMQDGSVLQLASPTGDVRPLRYDFNPKHWDNQYNKDYHIMSVLRCMKSVVPTRIDIAIDTIGTDLGSYKWIDSQSRKRETHEDGCGKIETLYIGSERSETRFRIYNKAKERIDKDDAISVKHPIWWRVEVQLRAEEAKAYLEKNPFNEIHCMKRTIGNGVGDYDIKTRAMLHYLTMFPKDINELGSQARAKYKQLQNALVEQVSEMSFAQIYEDNREKIREIVDTYKNLTLDTFDWESSSPEDLAEVERLKKEIAIQLRDNDQK